MAALNPPIDELWISEFDDAKWRYVATYKGWAKGFNEASTWHQSTASLANVSGSIISSELDAAGAIVGVELLRTSGSSELDSYALEVARAPRPAVSIPKALVEQGRKIKIIAMIGFIHPEGGGKVLPRVCVGCPRAIAPKCCGNRTLVRSLAQLTALLRQQSEDAHSAHYL